MNTAAPSTPPSNTLLTSPFTPSPASAPPTSEDFNALAPEDFDSPYEIYADLRAKCPVAHTDAWGGFWALMRHEDVANAATDYKTFTTRVQNVVPRLAFTGRRPPLHLDPPEHSHYRRAISPLLTQEKIAPLEAPIRRFASELLIPMIERGHGDICNDFSARLPIAVFAEWMNLPKDQVDSLREVGREYAIAVQKFDGEMVKKNSFLLYDMARKLIALRKASPMDPNVDVTSALLSERVDGEPLNDDMIIGTVRQVLVVGIIAPNVMIGSICVHLSRFPELQQQLRSLPELIPAAIEEYLRLYTPYRGFARTPTRDIELHGRTIKKDEPVALVYASANRDESVFPDADKFILNRENISEHLAFGRGPHNCPGAWLARLELRVAFEELLSRTSHFEINGPITTTLCPEIGALTVPLKLVKA